MVVYVFESASNWVLYNFELLNVSLHAELVILGAWIL